jgi:hypothetical protein
MKQKKTPTGKLLNWLDRNLLLYLAGFLLVFIPLYPKIPIADILPGYIVRLRPDDLLIALAALVFVIQLLRRKIRWHPLLTKIIIAYIAIGFLSAISAIFLVKSVPMSDIHVAKLFFHWFRRIQYFSLFFIFFAAVQTRDQAKKLILMLLPIIGAISIYGFGQKYLYWPVYSTMNREFSKGMRLYLTEHARVPSTFGGHYDAAAYIMVTITIVLAILLLVKNKWLKLASLLTYVTGFWFLILTASRTSFVAYLVSVSALLFILAFIKSFTWAFPRWLIVITFSILVMLSFGDLSERYQHILGLDKFKDTYYAALFSPKVSEPKNGMAIDTVLTPSDENPTAEKPTRLPADVYVDIPDEIEIINEDGSRGTEQVPRVYSENAYKYGLSAAIRLDALWPRAWAGFTANPLLGSGYSTLTKDAVGVFTEAESTDNEFLRTLGETGLLGFVTFFGAIIAIVILVIKNLAAYDDPLFQAMAVGFIAATIGLLFNAIYIDVFVASKIAESYWALAGLVLVIPWLKHRSKTTTPQDNHL